MQAIVYRRYGPPEVLTVEEVEKPVPAENEVLLKVRAAALNPLDWHFLRGSPYGMRFMSGLAKPKIQSFGIDVAGEVEAVGSGVRCSSRGTRFSAPAGEPALSLRARPKPIWPANPLTCPSNRQRRCLWPRTPPCRHCATRRTCSRDKSFSSTGLPEA